MVYLVKKGDYQRKTGKVSDESCDVMVAMEITVLSNLCFAGTG